MRAIFVSFTIGILMMGSGCGVSDSCSQTIGCARGSYRQCGYGTGSCHIIASDGSAFVCSSCDECTGGLVAAASWCDGSVGSGGSGGGSAGGNGGEPQVCVDYLACVAQLTPAALPSLIASYGPSGSCWTMGSALAASCASACQTGIAQAKAMPNAPAVCTNAQQSCSDGTVNGGESDVDCGGSCPGCGPGRTCSQNSDCASGTCGSDLHCRGGAVVVLPDSAILPASTFQNEIFPPSAGYAVQPYGASGGGTESSTAIRWMVGPNQIYSGSISTSGKLVDVVANYGTFYVSPPYSVAGGMRADFRATGNGELRISTSGGTNLGLPIYCDLAIDGSDQPAQIWYMTDASTGQLVAATVDPFGM